MRRGGPHGGIRLAAARCLRLQPHELPVSDLRAIGDEGTIAHERAHPQAAVSYPHLLQAKRGRSAPSNRWFWARNTLNLE